MSEDIVERLRHFAKEGGIINKDFFSEAADEIERLRVYLGVQYGLDLAHAIVEIDRLRAENSDLTSANKLLTGLNDNLRAENERLQKIAASVNEYEQVPLISKLTAEIERANKLLMRLNENLRAEKQQ